MDDSSRALAINCGYYRVAVFQCSRVQRGRSRSSIDKEKRREKIQQLFEGIEGFVRPTEFWDNNSLKLKNSFEGHCASVLDWFRLRWNPNQSARQEYTDVFSIDNWKALAKNERDRHAISECSACAEEHLDLQKTFPALPCFEPENLIVLNIPSSSKETVVTRKVLSELNASYESTFNHSFTESVIKHCGRSAGIAKKPSANEKKQTRRTMQRSVCASINKQFAENAALTFLSENESFSGYQRKRLSQSFEHLDVSKPAKKHFSDSMIEKYRDILTEKIANWPTDKVINWSEIGRQCGVETKNKGQVVKEIAEEIGIDLTRFPISTHASRYSRASKAKLPGNEISMPTMPTVACIKEDIKEMLMSGKLTLGEPCAPFVLKKVSIVDGQLVSTQCEIHGRKIPLLEIRKRLLKKQEKFMHLMSDDQIGSLSVLEVESKLRAYGIVVTQHDDCHAILKKVQRSRTLVLWHDHSTILGSGYLVMTIHTLYDPSVYVSTVEYEEMTGRKCARSVQELVEEPELYMICLSSSSASDQLATIADRSDCLAELSQTVLSSSKIPICDSLKFFVGDHPAQSFERGTQVGGTYKCGGCGCKNNRFDDLGHVFSSAWRSLEHLQKLVLQGKYGHQKGILKPFANLKKEQLVEELRLRDVFDLTGNKSVLASKLQSLLCGAQRVPTILLMNPTQSLSDVNLSTYTVLDSEPLHDLKGHLINLLTELPHILSGETKVHVDELLKHLLLSKKQNGYSGSDLRIALIEVTNLVQSEDVDYELKCLLSSVVKMSECLYAGDDKRTPKAVLQLYNCCWVHHELCKSLFPQPKEMTYEKMFGLYLHSLVVHAPRQYEIVCLRSVNAENQERMFQQAKQVASACSNRKPENVIPNVLLRVQAKAVTGKLSNIFHSAKSRVETVASKIVPFGGTRISDEFISARPHSYQAHLERISSFLVHENVWWERKNDGYLFYDSDEDPCFRGEGPPLNHFRSCSIEDIEKKSEECWKCIIEQKIELPCSHIRIYDNNGDFVALRSNVNEPPPQTRNGIQEVNDMSEGVDLSGSIDESVEPMEFVPTVTSTPNTCDEQSSQHLHVGAVSLCTPSRVKNPVPKTNSLSSTQVEENCAVVQVFDEHSLDAQKYQTKSANAISKVIGQTAELARYDKLHAKLKLSQQVCAQDQGIYDDILASLQVQVLRTKSAVAADIKKMEDASYTEHSRLPSADDQVYSELCEKLKYAKALTRLWNIRFS